MAEEAQAAVVVIVVAGPSGGGKTTLVRHLAAVLGNATEVYFDDYAAISTSPADMPHWVATGADPNQWQTPRLVDDVQALRAGSTVVHPDGTTVLQPAHYIVMEEPFGRERQEIAPLIDFVVVIDVPLEIALARRIRRTFSVGLEQWSAEQLLKHVDSYLDDYIAFGSTLYGAVNSRALASCDLAVDGRQPVEQLAEQITTAVRSRFLPG
jgi:uridine kinase